MRFIGKFIGDLESSFVEFEVDVLIDSDDFDELKENASCYEAVWQGKSETFENPCLMIGFDECESGDIELLKEHLDEDSFKRLEEMFEDSQRVRF